MSSLFLAASVCLSFAAVFFAVGTLLRMTDKARPGGIGRKPAALRPNPPKIR